MKLEVQLDGTEIFTTRFTIAHTYRNTIADASYKKMVRFSFKPGRRIAWEGYQDQTVISPAGRSVAGNIWMAGADDNAIILGVSFENSDEILMNTLHLALANKEVRTEIAKGLVVITSPVPDKIKP